MIEGIVCEVSGTELRSRLLAYAEMLEKDFADTLARCDESTRPLLRDTEERRHQIATIRLGAKYIPTNETFRIPLRDMRMLVGEADLPAIPPLPKDRR